MGPRTLHVTGTWSKGENDVMRVKMTFRSAFWAAMYLWSSTRCLDWCLGRINRSRKTQWPNGISKNSASLPHRITEHQRTFRQAPNFMEIRYCCSAKRHTSKSLVMVVLFPDSKWPKKEEARLSAKNAFSPRSPNDYLTDGPSTPDGAKGDPEAYNVVDTIRELSPQIRG